MTRTSTRRSILSAAAGLAAGLLGGLGLRRARRVEASPSAGGFMPFIGEIRLFAGDFAPEGWAFCAGQFLSISDEENDALFTILGTTYGGDGEETFALPDLRGRVAIGFGQGPGLSFHGLGWEDGAETVTLTVNQMPAHTHVLQASDDVASANNPAGRVLAQTSTQPPDVEIYDGVYTNLVPMDSDAILPAGGGQPVSIVQPLLALNYIIALEGVYPPQE